MTNNARRWRILAAGVAAGAAAVLGVAVPTATAEPFSPLPPQPAPVIAAATPGTPAAQSLAAPGLVPAAAAAAPAALVPATSGTLTDFFKAKGVTLQPQSVRDFKALNIVLPVPRGWSQVPDPNVPDAFAVIADRLGGDGIYTSNAAVLVYKLTGGSFDPREAITHGFIDSQQLPAWNTTKASLADFGGMPSAAIEGTYRENNMSLNTSRRHTIATAGADKYLVTLSVTTTVGEAVATADATDAITNGFRISPAGAAPQAAPLPPR